MTTLRHIGDQAVCEAVSDAVSSACKTLDLLFPGRDAGGITSNFQGLLEEVVLHMLRGQSVLDGRRGHTVSLPQLVIDDSFFGNPLAKGDLFVAVKGERVGTDAVLALNPDSNGFKALYELGDAWTSFGHAALAAKGYLERNDYSLEAAQELGLRVVPVTMIENAECGYQVVDGAL